MTPELPIDGPEPQPEAPPPAYDVCNPDRLPADRLAFVDAIQQQFLQAFAVELTTYLDVPVEPAPSTLDQAPLSRFLEDGASDAAIAILNLSPMKGQAWCGMSGGFLSRILDILLGAPQTSTPAARTSITEIEQHILREFLNKLVTTLQTAWASSGVLLNLDSLGTVDDLRQAVDPDATALILKCSLKFGEAEESFRVAVPVLAVRLAALQFEQSTAVMATGEIAARNALLEVVGAAKVRMEAVLGGSSIRLRDLAAMQPGQILMLSQPAGSQLECLVNGKPKYRGEWIAHGDRHGLQVDSLLEPAAAGKA